MKNYTFHGELKDLITQFIGAMDESIVKRYDEDGIIHKEIEVRYTYAPKTRTLHWLVNKQQHITLPVVSCWIDGISRDNSRVFNKIDGPTYLDQDDMTPLQPVPIDITMNIAMLAKYQNDMDQMVSNFVPYFDPYIILSWKHPKIDKELRSEVLWDGNLAYNYPTDIQATESYRVGVDTSFTIKGWLFKKTDPLTSGGIINTVITDFIGLSGGDGPVIITDVYEDFKDGLEFDRFVVSGIPTITRTDPSWLPTTGGDISLYGNLLFPESVYISGDSAMVSGMQYIDLFSEDPKLSADNPPFYGREISEFSSITDSRIIITIPELGTTGFLDIISLNSAGYGGIIKNADSESSQKDGLFII